MNNNTQRKIQRHIRIKDGVRQYHDTYYILSESEVRVVDDSYWFDDLPRPTEEPQKVVNSSEAIASHNSELIKKIKELQVPYDWNRGHKTEQRYKDILNRDGTLMDLYNQALDDVLSLIQATESSVPSKIMTDERGRTSKDGINWTEHWHVVHMNGKEDCIGSHCAPKEKPFDQEKFKKMAAAVRETFDDLKPFTHASKGTHFACAEIANSDGPTVCCGCTGHRCKENK